MRRNEFGISVETKWLSSFNAFISHLFSDVLCYWITNPMFGWLQTASLVMLPEQTVSRVSSMDDPFTLDNNAILDEQVRESQIIWT